MDMLMKKHQKLHETENRIRSSIDNFNGLSAQIDQIYTLLKKDSSDSNASLLDSLKPQILELAKKELAQSIFSQCKEIPRDLKVIEAAYDKVKELSY